MDQERKLFTEEFEEVWLVRTSGRSKREIAGMGRGHLLRLDPRGVAVIGAVVIDLFSRRVAGWSVGDRLHRSLALAALRQALAI